MLQWVVRTYSTHPASKLSVFPAKLCELRFKVTQDQHFLMGRRVTSSEYHLPSHLPFDVRDFNSPQKSNLLRPFLEVHILLRWVLRAFSTLPERNLSGVSTKSCELRFEEWHSSSVSRLDDGWPAMKIIFPVINLAMSGILIRPEKSTVLRISL